MADCSQHPRMSSGFPLPPIGVHLAGYDCLPCARKVYNRGLMRLWTETVEARKAAWDRFQASADPHTADGFIRACSDLGWVQGWTTVQLAEFRESYIPKLYEEALRQVEAMEEVTGDRMCYHLKIAFRCGHFDHGRLCRYITDATTADCGQHPRTSSGDPLPPIGVHLAIYDCLPCTMTVFDRTWAGLWKETVEAKEAAWARFRVSAHPQVASDWIRACTDLGWVQGWVMVQQTEFRKSYIPKLHEVARRQVEARHGLTGVLKMGTGRDTD
ncbi:MAG: hypothetical protein M1826_000860 [Phylliscum demangeonii]|nr:MAG: hypothetical protein M1826_000860 [Phylliscum demangeonii]